MGKPWSCWAPDDAGKSKLLQVLKPLASLPILCQKLYPEYQKTSRGIAASTTPNYMPLPLLSARAREISISLSPALHAYPPNSVTFVHQIGRALTSGLCPSYKGNWTFVLYFGLFCFLLHSCFGFDVFVLLLLFTLLLAPFKRPCWHSLMSVVQKSKANTQQKKGDERTDVSLSWQVSVDLSSSWGPSQFL